MGNYLACSPKMRSSQSARVVLPTGEMRQFKDATKAAELMMECPNFFIANSTSLQLGKRFAALSADEDLEVGNVYVMFPMRRVKSVVTAADMAMLFMAANSANKRIRVSPEEEKEVEVEVGEVEGLTLKFEEFEGFNCRMSVSRSRKPGLETIREDAPICLR